MPDRNAPFSVRFRSPPAFVFPSLLGLALLAGASAIADAASPAGAASEPHSPRGLIERGRWIEARTALEAARKSHPDDPQVLAALAEVRAAFGDLDEGTKLAERAVELAPKDGAVRATLADLVGEAAGKAGALKAMGLAKRFRREAEAAIALDPTLIGPRRGLIEFHTRAPGIAGGDKKKIPDLIAEITRIDPAQGELAEARLAQSRKDSVAAEAHLRKAVSLTPGSPAAQLALANWCAAPWRNRMAEAETHARAAREADPDRPAPVALLVGLVAQQDRWADVEALLEDSRRAFPSSLGPFYQAGRIALVRGGDLGKAEQWFRTYLIGEPEPGNPSLAHAHWRLANVLEKQGKQEAAVAELKTALSLNSGLDDAKKDLKRLGG